MQIEIPLKALSSNDAWQGRRFKTPAYQRYERDVLTLLPRIATITGEVEIFYNFFLKNWKRTDNDNLIKCLQDCLVKGRIIEDDRKVREFHVRKDPGEDTMKIRIVQI